MRGLMTERPLLISQLLEYAARIHADSEIVSRTVEGPIHRYCWSDARKRSIQLVHALKALDIREGDRVGTVAWNGYRHLELYYGVSGMGAIVHTLNPRLHPPQMTYIVNHAEDRVLFVDLTFVPLMEALAESFESVRHVVVMTDRENMPESSLDLLCYEELLQGQPKEHDWPSFDENTAAGICYTSGTTGNPKGVVYSHRSTVLHAYGVALPCALPLSRNDVMLPVVPMFHVNAWGLPYGAAMGGFKLVFPGPRMDGPGLTELMNAEGVTHYAGVPTVHTGLLAHWKETGESVPSMRLATSGGSALSRRLIDGFGEYDIDIWQGWGMTETSPVGTISKIGPEHAELSEDEKAEVVMRQGRPLFGVDLRIVDEDGQALPWDGESIGEVHIRGPWVASAYLGEEPGSRLVGDDWFPTGDVACIHPDGTLQITDRTKDVIKSGGEWISSIDLEDRAMRHPEVAMAAVIGIPDEKWEERPLLIAVPAPGTDPSKESVLEFLEGQVAKWWIPDDVIFVEDLPLGATGKVQKTRLREEYAG